ncbi:Wzz/FepE/Etk N-terminal domain-containing protein [Wohlfahrtiimonas chitiniclastica]|uniref:Wzz/FepE/Etk N-terminal domain-containing protein n=1 Tax=Wohlfahrtiimonas chitiniclastica TaxID=400946 RepID=UPI00164A168C|nr:Wzz/FepE/Etk N-terminal domain-containing protein [Wohlfahrtiimonas chitiniclastica]
MNKNEIFKRLTNQKTLLIAVLVVPFIISLLYFAFFALDRYVSSAQVVVRQTDSSSQPSIPGLAILTGGADPASREYTLYLKEYISSYDMLFLLENKIQWSAHYSDRKKDPLHYLASDASIEEKREFYNKMVTTNYDEMTGLLSINVQAYSGEFAQKVVQEILAQSKVFINSVSRDMLLEQSEFARKELIASTERYQRSKDEMLNFQNHYKLLDVEATAQSRLELISSLEAEIAKEQARLKALQSTLAQGAPQIKALNNKIHSLEEQIKVEKSRITSSNSDDPLNIIASEYRQLQVNMIVAEEFYKTSLAVVENAKLDAIKNVRSLITIVQPVLPEEPTYPRTWYDLITIFIVLSFLYGIICFVVASIKDHYE